MSYLFSSSRYQTKCVIKFLFKQLMTPLTLRFIFDHPLKQWLTGKKGEDGIQKSEYPENEMSFLDEIKCFSHNYLRAIISWKKVDTRFKNFVIFKGKSLFNKIADFELQVFVKKDSNTGVFQHNIFIEHLWWLLLLIGLL